jgi:hypothetical protein
MAALKGYNFNSTYPCAVVAKAPIQIGTGGTDVTLKNCSTRPHIFFLKLLILQSMNICRKYRLFLHTHFNYGKKRNCFNEPGFTGQHIGKRCTQIPE